jgi:hypothetical protein
MYTIWRTGHPINDEVSKALHIGTKFEIKHTELLPLEKNLRPAIAYGILRGTGLPGRNTGDTSIFRECDKRGLEWWEVDRGYFGAKHFDGYYRISLGDMQAKYVKMDLPEGRMRKMPFELLNNMPRGRQVLLCPPTEPVEVFYGMTPGKWLEDMREEIPKYTDRRIKVRDKRTASTPLELDLDDAWCVVTFNSSVGIDAALREIPVISSEHSVLHKWAINDISCIEKGLVRGDRIELLKFLSYCQFTLEEFRSGYAWETAMRVQKYGSL